MQSSSILALALLAVLTASSVGFLTPARLGRRAFAAAPVLASDVTPDVNGLSGEVPTQEGSDDAADSILEEIVLEGVEAEKEGRDRRKKIERSRYTLFVGNLPFDATDEQVRGLFQPHGTVELVNIPRRKESGQPRGFAFVDMGSAEELDAAVSAVDGSVFGGRQLRVTKSVPKEQVKRQELRTEPEGTKKIYVGNIPFETTQDEILQHFSQFGEVIEVYIPIDPATGTGRGFGFVTLKEEDAQRALDETNGTEFGGRKLVVSIPLPPGEKAPARKQRSPRTKLYIGNLSFYTVADTLTALFEEFGPVRDCYLPEDPSTGGTRGFGFVTMDKEDAVRAIEELDGCEIDGRIIRVNEAQPKGVRSSARDDSDGDEL